MIVADFRCISKVRKFRYFALLLLRKEFVIEVLFVLVDKKGATALKRVQTHIVSLKNLLYLQRYRLYSRHFKHMESV